MQQADIMGVVERAQALVAERYVLADVSGQIATVLGERAEAGRYSTVDSPESLAKLLTEDLQSVNGDRHLRLRPFTPSGTDAESDAEAAWAARFAAQAARCFGGVGRVECLPDNIGYLELQPILFPVSMSGPAITAAMRLVAGADALILDIRRNGGGDPRTVALVCGYLFDEPTHLFTMSERDGTAHESWSQPYVPGPRFGGTKPLYVLTSADTFSGAEELAYDLQQHGRARVVGERTGGGAHPCTAYAVDSSLEITIPVARPIHPVSGKNWEGTGVLPDLPVPATEALDAAVAAARALLG